MKPMPSSSDSSEQSSFEIHTYLTKYCIVENSRKKGKPTVKKLKVYEELLLNLWVHFDCIQFSINT